MTLTVVDLTIPSRGSRGFDVPTRQARLHSRMSTAVTAVAREGDRSEATGSLWARDTARRAPYRQPAGWRRDPSPLRHNRRPRRRRSAPAPGHRRKTCYRGGSRHGVSRERRARDQPSIRTVEYIDWHDVASVSASPYRRGLIGPGAAPSSVGAGLGGSAKTIRPFRRELRPLCETALGCFLLK